MNRAYNFDQWAKDFARAFAAAVPLESMQTQARGALLASANDEPEPATLVQIVEEAQADAERYHAAIAKATGSAA